MSGPLAGVKVLEIAQVYAVPAAASLLGDMGAEVVKIEPPWGDSTRYGRPLLPGEGRNFIGLNHGKRTMCVDIARPESRSVIEALIRQADVILINLRIDHVPAFKLTYDDCRAIRPDIIYLVNTAAGPLGPLSGLGGYDMTIAALAGIGASQGYMRGDQLVNGNGVAITDAGTSFLMVAAVSSALYYRLKTGEGQMIETSNLSTALNCQLQSLNSFAGAHPWARCCRRFGLLSLLSDQGFVHLHWRHQPAPGCSHAKGCWRRGPSPAARFRYLERRRP